MMFEQDMVWLFIDPHLKEFRYHFIILHIVEMSCYHCLYVKTRFGKHKWFDEEQQVQLLDRCLSFDQSIISHP